MRSPHLTQERLLVVLMGSALLGVLAAVLWPSVSGGRGGASPDAMRNMRVVTASLEMYPLPAGSLPR